MDSQDSELVQQMLNEQGCACEALRLRAEKAERERDEARKEIAKLKQEAMQADAACVECRIMGKHDHNDTIEKITQELHKLKERAEKAETCVADLTLTRKRLMVSLEMITSRYNDVADALYKATRLGAPAVMQVSALCERAEKAEARIVELEHSLDVEMSTVREQVEERLAAQADRDKWRREAREAATKLGWQETFRAGPVEWLVSKSERGCACGFWIQRAFEAEIRAFARKRERDALQSLMDLQHRRTAEADARWQAAHGKPDTIPDLGELIRWLEERAEQAERERNEATTVLRETARSVGWSEALSVDALGWLTRLAQRAQKAEQERNEANKRAEEAREKLSTWLGGFCQKTD